MFGFSAATGSYSEKHTIKSWSFSSNLTMAQSPDKGKSIGKGLVAVLSGVGGVSVLILGLGLIWCVSIKKKKKEEEDFDLVMDDEFERGTGPRKFSYDELAQATSDFAEEEKLGEGGFALEVACGRKPLNPNADESQRVLVRWVWELYGSEHMLEAADPRLGGDFDEQEMKKLMMVGIWCAHPDHELRPTMRQVIQALDGEVPLPVLPSKMPVPTYSCIPEPLLDASSGTLTISTMTPR